jgi:hypothetical protein
MRREKPLPLQKAHKKSLLSIELSFVFLQRLLILTYANFDIHFNFCSSSRIAIVLAANYSVKTNRAMLEITQNTLEKTVEIDGQ